MYIKLGLVVLVFSLLVPSVFAHLTDEDDIVKVIITDSGFDPNFVTIHPGSMVAWVNEGQKPHWPASDVHPWHTLYPGSDINMCETKENILDACKGLEKSGSFSFVFDKIGKWGIHDHLAPGLSMTVEVKEVDEPKQSILDQVINFILSFLGKTNTSPTGFLINEKFPTPEEFLNLSYPEQKEKIQTLSKKDPKDGWEFLKKTFFVNGQIVENPHQLAHTVGNEIYNQRGFEGISICDPTFAFGCYHGVTEKMLLDKGFIGIKEAEKSCLEIFSGKNELIASCIHGTGHGLLSWENLNVGKALKDCDTISEQYRSYCYDGVFMENSFGEKKIDLEKPWDFCSGFESQYHNQCARYQIYLFGESVKWDFLKLSKICDQAPNKVLGDSCYSGLGYLSTYFGKGDYNQIKYFCGLSKGSNQCIINAAIEVAFQEYRGWQLTSKLLCDTLEKDAKSECEARTHQVILSYNRTIEPDEIKQIKATEDLDEQEKFYLQLIKRVGVEQAQEFLFLSGLPFTGQTHLLNHLSGDYLYETEGAAGIVRCKEYFLASCYHGLILHSISVEGATGIDSVWTQCEKFGPSVTSQCSHALGHGFLTYLGYSKLPEAVQMCNDMAKKYPNFAGYNCRDGVFMENIWGVHEGKPSEDRWVKENNLFYPCNDTVFNSNDLDGCWSNQPSLMYQQTKGNLTKVGEQCLKVENKTHQTTCFNGLSRQIHPLTKGDAKATFSLCSFLPRDWQNYCIQTISISDFSVGGRRLSFELCASIDKSAKEVCYRGLFGSMGVYARSLEEYQSFCKLILEDDWKKKCLGK